MIKPVLKVMRVSRDAVIPKYESEHATCFDIRSVEAAAILPGEHVTVRTGLIFEPPEGWCIDTFSRSGHGAKHRISLSNSVGKIDNDYRGELMVTLKNDHPTDHFVVAVGDRIAQAELRPYYQCTFEEVYTVSSTARGSGGLGSTGR